MTGRHQDGGGDRSKGGLSIVEADEPNSTPSRQDRLRRTAEEDRQQRTTFFLGEAQRIVLSRLAVQNDPELEELARQFAAERKFSVGDAMAAIDRALEPIRRAARIAAAE